MLVSLLLTLLLTLTACSPEKPPPENRTTVQIWLDAGNKEQAFYQKVKALFEARYPKIGIHWKFIRLNDLKPSFIGHARSTVEPDVILLINDWLGELAQKDLLLPLSSFSSHSPSLPLSHLLPNMIRAMSYQDRLLAMPFSFETVALFSNTELIATPPQTFSELFSIGETLQKKGITPLVYENKNFYLHAPLFFGFGGRLFREDGSIALIGPACETSIRFAVDMQERRHLIPAKCNMPAMINLFGRGQVGMIITGPWSLPELERTPVRFAVTRLPDIEPGRPARPFIGIKGFAINRHSRVPHEAFTFVQFMSSEEIQRSAAAEIGILPCAATSNASLHLTSIQKGFFAGIEHGVPMPPGEQMKAIWQEGNWLLNEAFADPARPLSELTAASQERLSRISTAAPVEISKENTP
jgi:maltose/maltodextrin transport system substrate-binding protein